MYALWVEPAQARVIAMIDSSVKAFCKEILDEGLEIFDLSLGIVSKVENNIYQIVAVMPEDGVFQAGELFDLKDTYCREVIETGSTVALTQLGKTPGLCKHPLYSGLSLEAYIATPITIDGKVWGTLNFSSMKIRDQEFSKEEIDLIQSRAESLAEKLKANL